MIPSFRVFATMKGIYNDDDVLIICISRDHGQKTGRQVDDEQKSVQNTLNSGSKCHLTGGTISYH